MADQVLSDPFYWLFFLIGVAMLPFIAIMVTSFTKIVVVLSIARQAIGTAQSPPNMVIISLAIILTAFSMYPVIMEIQANLGTHKFEKAPNKESLNILWKASAEPIRAFMLKRAHEKDRELFVGLLDTGQTAKPAATAKTAKPVTNPIQDSDFIVLAPAFLISELSHAFQIGFLIYLPFLVIDMTVANLLMALGMQMLSPTTISLPFKLLLFVLVDGWRLLAEGLAKI